jgi:hypothetical protein
MLGILVSTLHAFLFTFVRQNFLLNNSPEITKMMMMVMTAAAAAATTKTTTTIIITQHLGNVKTNVVPVIIGATGNISKSKIPEQRKGNRAKKLQKTLTVGTTHILRKILV